MNKIKLMLVSLILILGTALTSNAQTIGYVDFQKVEAGYTYAKTTYKDIDNRILELQQYVIDKDKQFKAIDSPIQKKNFEEKTQREYKLKEDAVYNLKVQKEDEIYNNIMSATKSVAASKKIDIVLDYRVVLTGGVDLTNDVIQYLNTIRK